MKDLLFGLFLIAVFSMFASSINNANAVNCPCKQGLIISDTSACGSGE